MEKNESTAAAAAPWMTEIAGGVVAGVVAVAYALSYAALLFPAALSDMLPIGLALALVSAALGALWLAWRSQLPFAVGGPDGNTTSILAATAATAAAASGAASQASVLALLVVATLCCAALFLVLGFGRLGAAVRYVPYPVIGGFLASTGWLIALGAVRVLSGGTPLDSAPALIQVLLRPSSLAAAALALLYFVVLRGRRHPLVLPALLVGSCAVVLAGLRVSGSGDEAARAAGWLFESVQAAHWTPPWQIAWGAADGHWLAAQWLDILAVATVATITLLLGASGLEVMARSDISLDRELREHGWLNLATAALGGYLSLVSVGRSVVLLDSGVRTRLAGLVTGGVCLLALASAATLLQGVPKVVLAAFLLYLGSALLWEWVVEARRRMGRADWVLIVVILATTAIIGFTVAVLAGILASCLNFALSYSRVGVVQHDLDGAALRSTVQRPRSHQQLLAAQGTAIRVLVLRGVIFFGTASMLLERVRGFLRPASPSPRSPSWPPAVAAGWCCAAWAKVRGPRCSRPPRSRRWCARRWTKPWTRRRTCCCARMAWTRGRPASPRGPGWNANWAVGRTGWRWSP
jgi:SulP family sulfate permease